MHATMRAHGPEQSTRGIRGTFYPSDGPTGGSRGAILPKLIAIVVAMAVVRTVIHVGKRHAGPSRSSRRREAIAEFHRSLHAEEKP
jgi:hypothetical protein